MATVTTNTHDFTGPAPIDIGPSGMTPDQGRSPSLNGWQPNSINGSPWWREMFRRVDGDAVSPYNSATQAIMANSNPPTVDLYLYPSTSNGGNSALSTAVNYVRGDTPLLPLTVTNYTTPVDPPTAPFHPGQTMDGWPIVWTVSVTNGSRTVTGSSGFLTKMFPGGSYCIGTTAPAPNYYVQSVQSDTSLTLDRPYSGPTSSSIRMYGPFNILCTDAILTALGSPDMHPIVVMRDETTGLPSKLYEAYKLRSNDGGQTLRVSGIGYWDLVTGEQRPQDADSPTASALPTWPFQIMYDEALAGKINHPIRCTVDWGMRTGGCVWPALGANQVPNRTDYLAGKLPLGSRLRLSASWYNANRANYTPIVQSVLDALRYYGTINHDWYGSGYRIHIEGVGDNRWLKSDLDAIRSIPLTAFEALNNIIPQYVLSGPPSLSLNVPATFTFTYLFAAQNTNFSERLSLFQSNANYNNGYPYMVDAQTISNTNPGPITFASFTPTRTGTYSIYININNYWLPPPVLTYVV